jgi:hypothetical protein
MTATYSLENAWDQAKRNFVSSASDEERQLIEKIGNGEQAVWYIQKET